MHDVLTDDRITMLLTAVGVAVAVAAIALGVLSIYVAYLAIVGKREIIKKAEAEASKAAHKMAAKIAREVAEKAAENYLEENELLSDFYAGRMKYQARIPPEALASNEGKHGKVAKPHPEENEGSADDVG